MRSSGSHCLERPNHNRDVDHNAGRQLHSIRYPILPPILHLFTCCDIDRHTPSVLNSFTCCDIVCQTHWTNVRHIHSNQERYLTDSWTQRLWAPTVHGLYRPDLRDGSPSRRTSRPDARCPPVLRDEGHLQLQHHHKATDRQPSIPIGVIHQSPPLGHLWSVMRLGPESCAGGSGLSRLRPGSYEPGM